MATVIRMRTAGADPDWSPNTLRNYREEYERRIGPALGQHQVSELTRAKVEAWFAALKAAGHSRRTLEESRKVLRMLLNVAVRWEIIPANPARGLDLPARPMNAGARRAVSGDQLAQVVAAAGDLRTETMLRAIAEVGLRRGEVRGLRWGDLNLSARRLTVARQVVDERLPGGGYRKLVRPPKSRRESVVAVSPTFAARLADWYALSVVEGGAPADGFVWPGKDGGPMHGRSLARALERACERAGLGEWVPRKDGTGLRFRAALAPHRARHSAASVMFAQGVPLTVISAQLTHADPRITAGVYAHLVDERDLDRAAAVFERGDREPDRSASQRSVEAE